MDDSNEICWLKGEDIPISLSKIMLTSNQSSRRKKVSLGSVRLQEQTTFVLLQMAHLHKQCLPVLLDQHLKDAGFHNENLDANPPSDVTRDHGLGLAHVEEVILSLSIFLHPLEGLKKPGFKLLRTLWSHILQIQCMRQSLPTSHQNPPNTYNHWNHWTHQCFNSAGEQQHSFAKLLEEIALHPLHQVAASLRIHDARPEMSNGARSATTGCNGSPEMNISEMRAGWIFVLQNKEEPLFLAPQKIDENIKTSEFHR